MWNRLRRRDDETGQILVMVAGGMIVFLLIAGLVIDTGVGYRERRSMQNVADLASMAGTKGYRDDYLDGGRTGVTLTRRPRRPARRPDNGCVAADGRDWSAEYVKPGSQRRRDRPRVP